MEEFFENELAKKFEDMIENNEELYFDTEEYEDIIIYYLELGDISYAELATKYALKLHPTSIELKTKQLEVFLELERYTKAKELIDELKPSCMEMTDFLVCCAKYYSNLGNPKRSIEYCEKALELEAEFIYNQEKEKVQEEVKFYQDKITSSETLNQGLKEEILDLREELNQYEKFEDRDLPHEIEEKRKEIDRLNNLLNENHSL